MQPYHGPTVCSFEVVNIPVPCCFHMIQACGIVSLHGLAVVLPQISMRVLRPSARQHTPLLLPPTCHKMRDHRACTL
jgi:hypothetical protein